MFQAYGANPSAMKFSEVFTALKTGTMDGQENPFAQIHSARFHEAQKFLSLTGHVYTPAYVIAGTKRWQSFPADVRKILEEEAKATQVHVYQVAARFDTELLDKIKAAGVKVNEPNKDAFVKASAAIYKEFGDSVPGAGEMIEIANKIR
jgi:TRAP-type C4-dicarboxylate transport system substrate-binding protein